MIRWEMLIRLEAGVAISVGEAEFVSALLGARSTYHFVPAALATVDWDPIQAVL